MKWDTIWGAVMTAHTQLLVYLNIHTDTAFILIDRSWLRASGTRVSYFSNPDVSYEGFPTGTEDANNALSINKVKLTVSQFRDSKCLGSITISPGKLTLARQEGSEATVTVTGEYDSPSEGETVNATVNAAGKKLVSVSPSSDITDSNGQATFTITAKEKKGTAKVKFKAGCLKKLVTVKVN